MASSHEQARTSSRTPVFFLGIARNKSDGKAPDGEYGKRLECTPNLDLLMGAGSVRTGAL